MVPGELIVSVLETECRRSSVYKLMLEQNYMTPAARGHLATMNILHGDFRFFGDNVTSRTVAAIVSALATRDWSDSRPGASASRQRVAKVLRAGADLLARRLFGIDFDGCRTLGRYLIARASARFSSRAIRSGFSTPFVFSPV